MDVDSVDDAAEWDVVPAGRGHDGLRTLAADGFSGGVTDGRVWAMLTNGRVVGVVGGHVDDLADADLTAHEAPDPALPLLLVMREQSAEPRAQYYTEEMPLREVDERLREGGFTGFVELAENVLSGDYYLVYYGGERTPLAFVGGSRRLETGEDAFDRAAGEVGIYGVYAAEVSVVDVPGGEAPAAVGAAASVETGTDEPTDVNEDEGDAPPESTDDEGGEPGEANEDEADGPAGASEDESGDPAGASEDGRESWSADATEPEPAAWDGERDDGGATDGDAGDTDGDAGDTDADEDPAPTGATPDTAVERDGPETDTVEANDDGGETTPDEETGEAVDAAEATGGPLAASGRAVVENDDADGEHDHEEETDDAGDVHPDTDGVASDDGAVGMTAEEDGVEETGEDDAETTEERPDGRDDLREEIEALTAERDDLRERVETLTAERDDLREEVERLREERERVEREREALRERLESTDATAGEALSPAAALSGTNLFVRYRSKAEPTLERALDDGAGREAVDENLLLERHTTFETEGVAVDGQPYDEFLPSTLQYRFVEWLVRALPFELRDAAGKRPLGRLYKAIPSFDRAEIDGTVTVRTDEGEEERSFDVVVRDRKGAPLAVASLFDGREPATEAMLSELVEDARAAAAANESLGAAVFVTTSYYAPEALELAEAETRGGGLFNRGSRESYVRLDRSHGFHLCLVEARDDDFHLGVPDL